MPGKYAMIPIGKGLYRINVPRSAITGRYKTERRKGMTPEEYKLMLDMAQTSTPTLEEFLEMRAFDSNVEWRLPQGTISNLLDLALDRIEELEAKIQAVKDAWNIPGPAPMIHFQAQQTLVDEWPTLGDAVEALADG